MAETKTVGLVGVGRMGRCMLERLRKAGYDVVAFDPFPDTWPFIDEQGARRMESHAELARNASLVVMSLPASKHVLEAVRGLEDSVGPEHIIVDTSTVDPGTAREAAALVGKHGARFVDAPVLGRPGTVGLWLLPAGGDREAIDIARPTLEAFAKSVVHVGESGTGYAFKLLNQLMFSVINGISAEAMAIADAMGVDKKTFYDAVTNSGAATVSPLFRDVARRIVDGKFDEPTFTLELLCKDAGLAIQMARNAGFSPLITGFVQRFNEEARDGGLAKEDTSSLYKSFREYYATHRTE
jgi:3-hydroxyisobutyrate dehydrogenase-like beta-hydroxyacid dehydrogenase